MPEVSLAASALGWVPIVRGLVRTLGSQTGGKSQFRCDFQAIRILGWGRATVNEPGLIKLTLLGFKFPPFSYTTTELVAS